MCSLTDALLHKKKKKCVYVEWMLVQHTKQFMLSVLLKPSFGFHLISSFLLFHLVLFYTNKNDNKIEKKKKEKEEIK